MVDELVNAAAVALALAVCTTGSAADKVGASAIPMQMPDVLRKLPPGQKPFLHAVITQSDVDALSPHDERLARETADGEGDDGYLRSVYLAAAVIEASQLGAATVVVGDPLLRTQTLLDRNKKPYTIVTTLEIDFLARKGNRYQHLFFADEKPPAGLCDEGVVVVTSEEVVRSGARSPSRVELIAAIAKKTSPELYVTDLRFEPAERGGRKLRGVIRSSDQSACAAAAAPKSVKLIRRKDHHFYAAVVVNGTKLGDALIDTGATSLAISQRLAASAGVVAASDMTVETASGTVAAKKGVADVVTIAGMPVRSVDVAMLPGDGDALIGMAVLEAFDIAVSGDTMTLTAR